MVALMPVASICSATSIGQILFNCIECQQKSSAEKADLFDDASSRTTYAVPVPKSATEAGLRSVILGWIKPLHIRFVTQCWKFNRMVSCKSRLTRYRDGEAIAT